MNSDQMWDLIGGGPLVSPGPSATKTKDGGFLERPVRDSSGTLTIGVMGNRKPNSLRLLTAVAERVSLQRGYQVLASEEKETAAVGAPTHVVEALGREADLVLVGSGD